MNAVFSERTAQWVLHIPLALRPLDKYLTTCGCPKEPAPWTRIRRELFASAICRATIRKLSSRKVLSRLLSVNTEPPILSNIMLVTPVMPLLAGLN